MSENGRDATTTAHAEAAATIGDHQVTDAGVVPEHLRRALEDLPSAGLGHRVLRVCLSLLLAALLAGGVAWSAGVLPSPLSLLP